MIVRNSLAVLVGVFAAGGVIAVVESVGHSLAGDGAQQLLFVMVAIGYGLGALVASSIASRIAAAAWPAILACVLLTVLAVANLFMVTHPIWFVPVAGILLLGGYFLGRKWFAGAVVAA